MDFSETKNALRWEGEQLLLNDIPMILTPRWFFFGIMERTIKLTGWQAAKEIFGGAAYKGAYEWAKVQLGNGLRGYEVMDQYTTSLSMRGWGRFEIVYFDSAACEGHFKLHHSAVVLELGTQDREACIWVSGAISGCTQAILDFDGKEITPIVTEAICAAMDEACCEFLLQPSSEKVNPWKKRAGRNPALAKESN